MKNNFSYIYYILLWENYTTVFNDNSRYCNSRFKLIVKYVVVVFGSMWMCVPLTENWDDRTIEHACSVVVIWTSRS